MELNDLERIWKKQDKKLDELLSINLKLIRKINLKTAVSSFDKLARISILGRNLALVYSIISAILSIALITDLRYSIPGMIGALCMLLSYSYHTKTIKPVRNLNHYSMPVVELQRIICEFRVRSIGAGKYDFFTVLIWLVTIIPMFIKATFKKDIYANLHISALVISGGLVAVAALYLLNELFYKKLYGDQLIKAENDLNEIIEFERSSN